MMRKLVIDELTKGASVIVRPKRMPAKETPADYFDVLIVFPVFIRQDKLEVALESVNPFLRPPAERVHHCDLLIISGVAELFRFGVFPGSFRKGASRHKRTLRVVGADLLQYRVELFEVLHRYGPGEILAFPDPDERG